MTEFTVFYPESEERTFVDRDDRLFDWQVIEGHLHILEQARLIERKPDSSWKRARCIHVHPPGTWLEVATDYEC